MDIETHRRTDVMRSSPASERERPFDEAGTQQKSVLLASNSALGVLHRLADLSYEQRPVCWAATLLKKWKRWL